MTALRTKAQLPVGSAHWITDENDQVSRFGIQESEDFAFSTRNEVEWLNEHMADIFSKDQVNVTEIFKTPGKLRGKTPRTARKRNPMDARAPLTDLFSTNGKSFTSKSYHTGIQEEIAKFRVAEDTTVQSLHQKSDKVNTDSGYHGMSEDETNADEAAIVAQSFSDSHNVEEDSSPPKPPVHAQKGPSFSEERSTTDGSFQSAREDLTSRESHKSNSQIGPNTASIKEPDALVPATNESSSRRGVPESKVAFEDAMDVDEMDKESVLDDNAPIDESRSPSVGSSPPKALVRKSSLTFAALPAREPLTTKKSIGSRISRTSHLDQSKGAINRGSFLGRFTGGKSLGGSRQPEPTPNVGDDDEMDVDGMDAPALVREESDGDTKMAKLHSKSSTQRLHDRINMLGKSQPARPTKSIPASVSSAHPAYPELLPSDLQTQVFEHTSDLPASTTVTQTADDDDDWIKPPPISTDDSSRPKLAKSTSVDVMEDIRGKHNISDQEFGIDSQTREATREPSPLRQLVAVDSNNREVGFSRSVSIPIVTSPLRSGLRSEANHVNTYASRIESGNQSTTPVGTPSSKRYPDGPLSASKSKLQSIMKTARGLFTSSAGVSAQAKMETLSPPSMRTRGQAQESPLGDILPQKPKASRLNGELYPDLQSKSPIQATGARKTRSSTEKEEKRKEREAKDRQQIEQELERVQQKEIQALAVVQKHAHNSEVLTTLSQGLEQHGKIQTKPTRQSPRRMQSQQEPKHLTKATEGHVNGLDGNAAAQLMGPPLAHPQNQSSQLRRPTKPAKEVVPKPKPQPVAIRVGTLSQRIPLNNSALSSSLQESLPSTQPKNPGLGKKASNASIQTSASNTSLKSSVTSTTNKPKALLAAERKKEQDERELQRKVEQKREIERKRAAQQEELRRQEQVQRQEVERQRERERSAAAEDPKKLAHKQAIEKRRLELEKKNQQRVPQRLGNDIQERAQAVPATNRQDLGGARPPSRVHTIQDHSRPAPSHPGPNPARPPMKRVFEPEMGDEPARPARIQGGSNYQQADAKRRRTEDEDLQEVVVRPTMAPPIRQSNIRKDAPKASIFSSGYTTAPQASGSHHAASSLHKATTVSQAYQQHQYQTQPSRPAHPTEMAKYTNGKIPFAEAPNPAPPSHRTPHNSKHALAKSSPQYPNGENIDLADIPTDSDDDSASEDEKQAKGAMLPKWVQSPNLRTLLEHQEMNQDPDVIFGPTGPVVMEEMFKDRHQRFRNRTSSANWSGQDRLTQEEIERDNAGRERLRREGGWTFGL